MPSPLEILPTELFLRVVENLRHHDLAIVTRISHGFNRLIEPLLWTKIELHCENFHEHYIHNQLRNEEIALQRPYCANPEGRLPKKSKRSGIYFQDRGRQAFERAARFLHTLQDLESTDKSRAKQLKGLVRWLCLPLHWEIHTGGRYVSQRDIKNLEEKDIWNTLASLRNIEHLEISAYWIGHYNTVPFTRPLDPLPKLRTLKLRGYIPLDFAQYLLESARTIIELQLGILDAPIGRDGLENPPPPVPEKYKHLSEDELWELDVDDYEDLRGDCIPPRPLACVNPEIVAEFTSLKKLYLCRPCDAGDRSDFIYHSKISAKRVMEEWASLVRATRKSLTHLTFDHRLATHENAPDGTDNAEFMRSYCHGPGYQQFVESVLPVFLEEDWPVLETIWLFGFEFDEGVVDSQVGNGVDIPAQLKNRVPGVEVHAALGRRMIMWDDSGEALSSGDVLDTANGFSSDSDESEDE